MVSVRFEAVRRAFLARERTWGPDPSERVAWHRGRERYAVWVVRLDDRAVVARAASLAASLGATIRPVEPRDLHVTVHVAGFPSDSPHHDDDVSWATLEAQAASLAEVPAGTISVGGANSFATAAFLEVEDHGVLAAVRSALGSHHEELRFAPFDPHLTVGTYLDAWPISEVASRLAAPDALLRISVTQVHLITFDAQRPGASLRTERVVLLQGVSS